VLSEMVGETLVLARQEALVTIGEYVNSLGMRFVPVAGTKVLFSVWETRVQDYELFAQETRRGRPKTSFQQEPTHPAVYVSWECAVAFCDWLTKKEGRRYRLPTDDEWSVAVGLKEERGSTPEEKNLKLDGYPWGKVWPPPFGAGNYDSSLDVDDFDYTSPVGSFAPNAFGLYDLGGNVQEWCEDLYTDNDQDDQYHSPRDRVVRGGSWRWPNSEIMLRSSCRDGVYPTNRYDSIGFRCVMVISGG
jgi:formylglycine-generating enzyme required for sulfatase activity